MTADVPPPPPDPVLRDDRLLDAIRCGEPPPVGHPADDPVATLLTDWHAKLMARARQLDPTAETPAAAGRTAGPAAPPTPATAAQPTAGAAPHRLVPARPDRVGRTRTVAATGPTTGRRRRRTPFAGATLALLTVASGLWLGAARAEPGGLFWPVTELVYAERAESLATERKIGRMLDEARRDLADGRYADARHHLEQAGSLLGTLGDDETVRRLRGELDELRHLLPPPTPTGPPAMDADIETGAVPVPSATDTATSIVQEPALTDPASPRTTAGPTPTEPAPTGLPTKPTRGAPAARPSTPAANPERHLPSAPAPTAPQRGAEPHREDTTVTRLRATGPRSDRPTSPDHAMADRTGRGHDTIDGARPGQPATTDRAGTKAGQPGTRPPG